MKRVLPGFGLSLGFTLVYLSLLVLLPLAVLAFKAGSLSFEQFWRMYESMPPVDADAALGRTHGVAAMAAETMDLGFMVVRIC